MVLPAGRVFKLYCPERCNATPQADMAPVQEASDEGLGFCAVGSGWAVLMIQSALPAVSALVLSNRTRLTVAASARTGSTGTVAATRVTRATNMGGRRIRDLPSTNCRQSMCAAHPVHEKILNVRVDSGGR